MGANHGVIDPEDNNPLAELGANPSSLGTRVGQGVLLVATFCFLTGTAVTVTDVLLRAVAGKNLPGAIETTALTVGLGALLSIPACYLYKAHVTAKLLSEIAPDLFARPLGIFGTFCSAIFAALMFGFMAVNLKDKIGSPETTSDLQLTMWVLLAVVTFVSGVGLIAALRALFAAITAPKTLEH